MAFIHYTAGSKDLGTALLREIRRLAERRIPYLAPEPPSTAGSVRTRIWKSSQIDQLSMLSRSSLTQVSKSLTSFLPEICHRQVIPGFTLRRRLWAGLAKFSTS